MTNLRKSQSMLHLAGAFLGHSGRLCVLTGGLHSTHGLAVSSRLAGFDEKQTTPILCSHDHTTAVDPLNINRRDTGELRWRLNMISPSLFFSPRFTLAPEKEKLDLIYLNTAIDSDMGQQSARTTFFSKLLRSHVLRYRDAMKGSPCLRRSSGIYQCGLVFIRGSRYAARSEPLPDKAFLVGVAGTATHSRVL